MKKPLLIIMAVAILGVLGIFIAKNGGHRPTVSVATVTQSDTSSSNAASNVTYKDGTYTGSQAGTIYGTVQVAAVVSGGKITDVRFLQMPHDQGNSKVVTAMAEPQLKAQALSKQSAHIDFVSGATQTSQGFEQSLQNALNQAAG